MYLQKIRSDFELIPLNWTYATKIDPRRKKTPNIKLMKMFNFKHIQFLLIRFQEQCCSADTVNGTTTGQPTEMTSFTKQQHFLTAKTRTGKRKIIYATNISKQLIFLHLMTSPFLFISFLVIFFVNMF